MMASLGSVAYNEKTFVGEMITGQGGRRISISGGHGQVLAGGGDG